jgi:hypothetical protein
MSHQDAQLKAEIARLTAICDALALENAALRAGAVEALRRYEMWMHPSQYPDAAVGHIADVLLEIVVSSQVELGL